MFKSMILSLSLTVTVMSCVQKTKTKEPSPNTQAALKSPEITNVSPAPPNRVLGLVKHAPPSDDPTGYRNPWHNGGKTCQIKVFNSFFVDYLKTHPSEMPLESDGSILVYTITKDVKESEKYLTCDPSIIGQQDTDGMGDSVLFSAHLCNSDPVNYGWACDSVAASQGPDGRFWRNPARIGLEPPQYPNMPRTTFSPDHTIGVLLYLLVEAKERGHQERAIASAEKFWEYIKSNYSKTGTYALCPDTTNNVCPLTGDIGSQPDNNFTKYRVQDLNLNNLQKLSGNIFQSYSNEAATTAVVSLFKAVFNNIGANLDGYAITNPSLPTTPQDLYTQVKYYEESIWAACFIRNNYMCHLAASIDLIMKKIGYFDTENITLDNGLVNIAFRKAAFDSSTSNTFLLWAMLGGGASGCAADTDCNNVILKKWSTKNPFNGHDIVVENPLKNKVTDLLNQWLQSFNVTQKNSITSAILGNQTQISNPNLETLTNQTKQICTLETSGQASDPTDQKVRSDWIWEMDTSELATRKSKQSMNWDCVAMLNYLTKKETYKKAQELP